jgi:hypothetical protein
MTPALAHPAARRLLGVVAVLGMLALAGCAALNSLDSDVSTWSRWPTERKPATYAFERLPSQQAQPQHAQMLEDAARPAVEAAGFLPAVDPAAADVTVQLGARITATDRYPFDDPYWWGPGWPRHYYWPYYAPPYRRAYWGPGWGYGYWGMPADSYGYERQVAVLIRDRRTGEPLYEGSAVSDGFSPMIDSAIPAMFRAVLRDFPAGAPKNPHRVTIDLRTAG